MTHQQYFDSLNSALRNHHRLLPCLIIDLDNLDQNISQLTKGIDSKSLRVVTKSIPSFELIDYVMQRLETKKLMVFHQPFLTDLCQRLDPECDILTGKPFPVKTIEYFYKNLPSENNGFDPIENIQWLVDSPERIFKMIELAKHLNIKLRLNVEIDVGLRRGGFNDTELLKKALDAFMDHQEWISFSGFMGYDAHVDRVPKFLFKKFFDKSNNFYHSCISLVKSDYPELWKDDLTFNGSGSPTLEYHKKCDNTPLNDFSVSSCLVKPTQFDTDSLSNYTPACFIATPVIKKFENTTIPVLEKFKFLLNLFNKMNKKSFFIYGGDWKAKFCYPKLSTNKFYGKSTNQCMVNGAIGVDLELDDFIFLRPTQSEFVFLQFGELLLYRDNQIVDSWSLLKNN